MRSRFSRALVVAIVAGVTAMGVLPFLPLIGWAFMRLYWLAVGVTVWLMETRLYVVLVLYLLLLAVALLLEPVARRGIDALLAWYKRR